MIARSWLSSDVVWGDTLCSTKCGRLAIGLLDGEPACADCADLLVERAQVAGSDRDLADQLGPPLDHLANKRGAR